MTVQLRKLAIHLSCLHVEDRQWILDQLPSTDRLQLDALLQEVNLLGLAADPSVIDSVMTENKRDEPQKRDLSFDETLPSFWLGLLLQTLSRSERAPYLEVAAGSKSELLRWNKEFSTVRLPGALLESLKTSLDAGDAHAAR